MNIQEAKRQLYLLREGRRPGAPQKLPPATLAFGPCQRCPPSGPTVAHRPTSMSTLPLWLGRRPAICKSICSRAHLCGVGSHSEAWRGCDGRSRQPAAQTVGTRFNWQNATGRRMALLPRRTRQTFTAYLGWTFVKICDIKGFLEAIMVNNW